MIINEVVDGLGMLLFQARPGFRLWFGREPEVTDDLRRIVLPEESALVTETRRKGLFNLSLPKFKKSA